MLAPLIFRLTEEDESEYTPSQWWSIFQVQKLKAVVHQQRPRALNYLIIKWWIILLTIKNTLSATTFSYSIAAHHSKKIRGYFMEPTEKIRGAIIERLFQTLRHGHGPRFIIQTLIKMKRVAEVMVVPTCLNLFQTIIIIVRVRFSNTFLPCHHLQLFSNPFFFVCKKKLCNCWGKCFPN